MGEVFHGRDQICWLAKALQSPAAVITNAFALFKGQCAKNTASHYGGEQRPGWG